MIETSLENEEEEEKEEWILKNICQEETRFDKGLARARTQRLHLVSGSLVFLVKGVENPLEQRVSFYIQPRRWMEKKRRRRDIDRKIGRKREISANHPV